MTSPPSLNRQILALAVPAFGALVAEPLFVLGDTAIVGHLGTEPLAGLTLGSTVIQTVVGLMVFLSYSTTPAVARALGQKNLSRAYESARNGMWVALLLGIVLALVLWVTATPILMAMGGDGATLHHARHYLLPSLAGLPGMLLVLAAVGVLRGLQDTKTPLYVASTGAVLNLGLSFLLVYRAGLGVAGSAIATAIIQWTMAVVLGGMVLRGVRKHSVPLTPTLRGLGSVFAVGFWLMLRTLSLRVALVATVFVIGQQGAQNLAAYQLTMTFFNFLAFALDSLAIAAQALLGKEMGARDMHTEQGQNAVARLKNRLVRWSLGFGIITGLLCPLVGFFGGRLFTPDQSVQHLFALAMLVVAVGQPLAAYVFILDGVLIGAQDVRYLALASLLTLGVYLPLLTGIFFVSGGTDVPDDVASWAFVAVWVAYAGGYMGVRGVTLGFRVRNVGAWAR